MKCKVYSDSKAAAEEEEEEKEEAEEKIRGKRRETAAWGRRGRTRERCRQDGDGVGPSRWCGGWGAVRGQGWKQREN